MTFNERDKFRSQQDPQRCVLAPLKGAAVFLFFFGFFRSVVHPFFGKSSVLRNALFSRWCFLRVTPADTLPIHMEQIRFGFTLSQKTKNTIPSLCLNLQQNETLLGEISLRPRKERDRKLHLTEDGAEI